MKRFLLLLTAIIISITAAVQAFGQEATSDTSQADTTKNAASEQDSIRISLLTCGAYDEVWTLYGHSALRIELPLSGEDIVANYGLFDFNQPFFVSRFVFGKCDYMMGLMPFSQFIQEFASRKASVYEQEINLTQQEKKDIIQAVAINSLPQNCEYRYNYFYDNCATRPRDIILNNIPDRIVYRNDIDTTLTFRQLIHENNAQKPWCRLGNDLLLGVYADQPTSRADQQFLPGNLMRDFAKAEFVNAEGKRRPVVIRSQWLLQDNATYANEFPLSPFVCGMILLAVAILLSVLDYRKPLSGSMLSKTAFFFDITLFTLSGLLGLILFLMIFSEHPTVSLNLQILTLNPLYIFLLWRIVPEIRGRKKPYVLGVLALCAILALICDTLIQDFADGMVCVTAALILRHRRYITGV